MQNNAQKYLNPRAQTRPSAEGFGSECSSNDSGLCNAPPTRQLHRGLDVDPRYVSDALENLFPVSAVRHMLRRFVEHQIKIVSPMSARRLHRVAHHYGGKCMAFPALWILQHSFRLSLSAVYSALLSNPFPVVLSLSTSIMDDFLDGEINGPSESLMLCYALLLSARCTSASNYRDIDDLIIPLVDTFLADPTDNGASSVAAIVRAESSLSLRIGNFHRLIARELYRQVRPKEVTIEAAERLAGALGDWCSRLDDVLDLPIDLRQGQRTNFPLKVLCSHGLLSVGEIHTLPSSSLLLRAAAASHLIVSALCADLKQLVVENDLARWPHLQSAFVVGGERLPALLQRWCENWRICAASGDAGAL